MGYTTDFTGRFDLDKPLTEEHAAYLRQFAGTRRMRRDPVKAASLPDPIREAVNLPIGEEGEYFVGGAGMCGQDHDASILDYNNEPASQPGLWCQWVPTEENDGIEWDEGEKFYDYVEWLKYLIDRFLWPWGYVLNGTVEWDGEERGDVGIIEVVNNVVTAHEGVLTLPPKTAPVVAPSRFKPSIVALAPSSVYRILCPHCHDEIALTTAVVVKS